MPAPPGVWLGGAGLSPFLLPPAAPQQLLREPTRPSLALPGPPVCRPGHSWPGLQGQHWLGDAQGPEVGTCWGLGHDWALPWVAQLGLGWWRTGSAGCQSRPPSSVPTMALSQRVVGMPGWAWPQSLTLQGTGP